MVHKLIGSSKRLELPHIDTTISWIVFMSMSRILFYSPDTFYIGLVIAKNMYRGMKVS